MNLSILIVEDDEKIREPLVENLVSEKISGYALSVESAESFDIGLNKIKDNDFDIIILDLYRGDPRQENEKSGLLLLEKIQQTAFVPVIFYSGLTVEIEGLKSEVVGIVNKGDGLDGLLLEIRRIVESSIALIKKKVYSHVRKVFREYFWETIHKDTMQKPYKDISLGYLLLKRLAHSLSRENIKDILGDEKIKEGKVHPMEFYIYPVLSKNFELGEILEKDGLYFIILTPSCDFIESNGRERKAKKVLLIEAISLQKHPVYIKYLDNKEKQKQNLLQLIESRRGDRYFFLPGTVFLENLVLDFQEKIVIPYDDMEKYKRVAKLDNPFSESMLSSFLRYYNRIGYPDLDAEYIIAGLES